jgi:RNAse (barnase) inhibitor barstar
MKNENELWDVLYHHQEQFTETVGVDGQEKENEMHQLFIDIIREAIDKAEKEAN